MTASAFKMIPFNSPRRVSPSIFAILVTTLLVAICDWHQLPSIEDAQQLAAVAPKDPASNAPPPQSGGAAPAPTPPPVKPAAVTPVQAAKPAPAVKPAPPAKPLPPAKPTDPTVVRIKPSGTTTTTRPKLKDGQTPSDTTLTVRTDEAGKVQSMTVEVEPAALLPYNKGKGHHPVAKRAFEGAPNYDANKALAVPKAELDRLGLNHRMITGVQLREYTRLRVSRNPLTWDSMAKIETDALIECGMKPGTAKATVEKAIQALKDSGVTAPVRIPWGK